MTALPRLLVVTPTLGESAFLEETIRSVARLTGARDHVLVAPEKQLAALKKRFPHTTVVPDAGRAGGIYGALNAGIAQAPAPWGWFTYINDDDVLLPGFDAVLRQHTELDDPEPVTYGRVQMIDEHGTMVSEITVERDPAWIPALLQQSISPVMQQGMLFRHDVVERLQGFDTRFRLCADLDFWARALAGGDRFRFYNEPVAQFRLRSGQLSGNTMLTELEQQLIVRTHFPQPIPIWRRRAARLRYRWQNLPRYAARFRRRGVRTSYQLLQHA